jgi:hypothetical protein
VTRQEAATILRGFVRDFRVAPHDAAEIYAEVPAEGIDAETLGDYLDGAGYPELAAEIYATMPDLADSRYHEEVS